MRKIVKASVAALAISGAVYIWIVLTAANEEMSSYPLIDFTDELTAIKLLQSVPFSGKWSKPTKAKVVWQ